MTFLTIKQKHESVIPSFLSMDAGHTMKFSFMSWTASLFFRSSRTFELRSESVTKDASHLTPHSSKQSLPLVENNERKLDWYVFLNMFSFLLLFLSFPFLSFPSFFFLYFPFLFFLKKDFYLKFIFLFSHLFRNQTNNNNIYCFLKLNIK